LASKREVPRVVDELPGNLDVLARVTDVMDGAVMIFSAALEGDACVFWTALDDLAAGLSMRQRCRTGSRHLYWSSFAVPSAWGAGPRHRIWHTRTLSDPQGWVFVGDGDELSDSSEPPLAAALSGLVAQQLLCHGERLHRSQLTSRASTRRSGGGEGERRLCALGWEVGGLEIFFRFYLGRGALTMDDRLGVAPCSVAAAKMLKSCIGVGHVEADLENTPQPPTWHAKCQWISRCKNMGTMQRTQRNRTQGLYA
jgi:hypothetical protein